MSNNIEESMDEAFPEAKKPQPITGAYLLLSNVRAFFLNIFLLFTIAGLCGLSVFFVFTIQYAKDTLTTLTDKDLLNNIVEHAKLNNADAQLSFIVNGSQAANKIKNDKAEKKTNDTKPANEIEKRPGVLMQAYNSFSKTVLTFLYGIIALLAILIFALFAKTCSLMVESNRRDFPANPKSKNENGRDENPIADISPATSVIAAFLEEAASFFKKSKK